MNELADRRCVVTGASSGVGRAIALELAERGAAVLGLARRFDDAPLAELTPGTMCERRCDVSDEAAVNALFAKLPAVDLLVCCAGHGVFGAIDETSATDLRRMLDVHVVGTFLCVRAARARMGAGAHIVVIGSTATRWSFADTSAYTAAKAGQEGLARALGEELRPAGIGVTRVVLGAVDTPIWDSRPGFDRSKMLDARVAAATIVDAVAGPEAVVEELLIRPPSGNL